MARESKTLFVRNLPFTTTKEKLEDTFSDIGPIKQCFIVTDPGTEKSKGYGYVQFTLREDAVSAKQMVKYVDGRRLYVDYADISRKKSHKRPSQPGEDRQQYDAGRSAEAEKEQDKTPVITKEDQLQKGEASNDSSQRSTSDLKYHKAKIVLLSCLPGDTSQADVETFLLRLNVKHAAEVKVAQQGKAHVKFKCIRDAKRAIRKLDKKTYRDSMLRAIQLSQEHQVVPQEQVSATNQQVPQVQQKKCKIIVRNLSYKCKEEDLRKAFEKCGTIAETNLPTNAEGDMRGFGFVQFSCLKDAKMAIESMNAVKILGRPVAVDWAIPKDRFETAKAERAVDNDSVDESDSDGSETSTDNEKTATPSSRGQSAMASDAKKTRLSSESDASSSDEQDSCDSDEESAAEEDDSDDDGDDSGDHSSDSGNASDGDTDSQGNEDKKKQKGTSKPSDVDEGKTIFIRNLAFECDDEGLAEHFQQYGDLVYSRVVINQKTEHSQGVAFVKFRSKASVDKLLEQAKSEDIVLQNRSLILSLAVTRNQSAKFNEKKSKEKKDNRNLYLAREGMIRPGTQSAEGLSTADLERRSKVESVKRQKLKNINIFISPLRLSVRNIPATVTDKELRQLLQKAAGDSRASVTECRIMRDLARTNSKGVGKSLGFGFVSFTEHEHALAALRHANNNPDIFENNKRLIVEFSLENRKALEAKEKRKEKQQMKQEASQEKGSGDAPSRKRAPNKSVKTGKIPILTLSDKDKKARAENPGPKGLPSHWGPKIRHKPRQTQQQAKKAKKNKNKAPNVTNTMSKSESKKRPVESNSEGPDRKKQKKNKYKVDSFDTLVNKYKQTLVSNKKAGGSKWFE